MPRRNVPKLYLEQTFYHVYNRGVNKQKIFLDEHDYAVFLNLLKRYLDDAPVKDKQGREYPWLHNQLELAAFCLMPNHFHLLIFQNHEKSMELLLRGVSIAYTMYFNKKYKRVGPLFQSTYKASLINNDAYLNHISRYIHMNPKGYDEWEFSSLPYYMNKKSAGWVQIGRIMELFNNSPSEYKTFMADYEEYKNLLDITKAELAN